MKIRPAATLVPVRDGQQGLEVLLAQRSWEAVFMPGFHVFPGGRVDETDEVPVDSPWAPGADSLPPALDQCTEGRGLAHALAAVRECFEEVGMLWAVDAQGRFPDDKQLGALAEARAALYQGQLSLADLLARPGLRLPLDRLAWIARWITPPGPPRRFDTQFFLAKAPPGQTPVPDGSEIIHAQWLPPARALEDHLHGERLIAVPTVKTLRLLKDFANVDEALRHVHAQPPDPFTHRSWPVLTEKGPARLEPGAPGYDEARKRDPDARGSCPLALKSGEPVRLGAWVRRITAPNGGLMTGPGTNTYILGEEPPFAVIDPGPANEAHLEAILELTGGRIAALLATHTHPDHSPGISPLAERTGAPRIGLPPPDDGLQDTGFQPDLIPADGQVIPLEGSSQLRLRAIHTPGHASNHVCYLLEEEDEDAGMLFSGDHIMQGSTVIINPPDGDMAAYLASLRKLHRWPLRYIAPGHGYLMAHPREVVDYLISHRMAREHKLVRVLRKLGSASLEALTPRVYDDVPKPLQRLGQRSLLAHLLGLQAAGRVELQGDQWGLIS